MRNNSHYDEVVVSQIFEQLDEYFADNGTDISEVLRLLHSAERRYGEWLTDEDKSEFESLYDLVVPCLDILDGLSNYDDRVYLTYGELRQLHDFYEMACNFKDFYEHNPRLAQACEAAAGIDSDNTVIRTLTPVTRYNISELHRLLVDEGIIVGIDERQFADCINQANIKPLWEKCSKNRLKLVLKELKWYYQDPQQRKRKIYPTWYLECCESINMTTQDMGRMRIDKKARVKFCEKMKSRI